MPPVEFTYLQQLTDTEISVIRHRKTFMADAKLQLAAFIAGKHPLAKEWGFHPPSQDPKDWDFDQVWAMRNFIVHLQKQAVELATDHLDELHPRSYGDPDLLPVSETLKPFTLNGRDAVDVVAGTIRSDKSNVRDWYSQQFLKRRLIANALTSIKDSYNLGSAVAMTGRVKTIWWYRVIHPPCCARCAILAGRKAQSPTMGFERHPGCDCTQMPVPEGVLPDILDPYTYFDSLSEEEQNRKFGKEVSEILRTQPGADISQLVNAKRGMMDVYDSRGMVLYTNEGAGRSRSSVYRWARHASGLPVSDRRLTPQAIMRYAQGTEDPDAYARQALLENGYLYLGLVRENATNVELRGKVAEKVAAASVAYAPDPTTGGVAVLERTRSTLLAERRTRRQRGRRNTSKKTFSAPGYPKPSKNRGEVYVGGKDYTPPPPTKPPRGGRGGGDGGEDPAARAAYIEMLRERQVQLDVGKLYSHLTNLAVEVPRKGNAQIKGGHVHSLIKEFIRQVEDHPSARGTKTFFGPELTADRLLRWFDERLKSVIDLSAPGTRVSRRVVLPNGDVSFEIIGHLQVDSEQGYEVLIPVRFLKEPGHGIVPTMYGTSGENLKVIEYGGGQVEFR